MMIIAVDFDGTLVDHKYPDIGDEVPGAFKWLAWFQSAGCKLILWTIRSNDGPDGPMLTQAVDFCRQRGIEFYGINNNPDQKSWSSSPKAYAHATIDDAAVGCPLREHVRAGSRPIADWSIIGPMVMKMVEERAAKGKQ